MYVIFKALFGDFENRNRSTLLCVVVKERTMKVMMSVLITATLLLAGCNTMHGLGQDVEKVGDKIQDKSAK